MGLRLPGWRGYARELARDDAFAFLYADNLVDADAGIFLRRAAGPADFQRLDALPLAETEVDARVARAHVARSAHRLAHLGETFRRQREARSYAVTI